MAAVYVGIDEDLVALFLGSQAEIGVMAHDALAHTLFPLVRPGRPANVFDYVPVDQEATSTDPIHFDETRRELGVVIAPEVPVLVEELIAARYIRVWFYPTSHRCIGHRGYVVQARDDWQVV